MDLLYLFSDPRPRNNDAEFFKTISYPWDSVAVRSIRTPVFSTGSSQWVLTGKVQSVISVL